MNDAKALLSVVQSFFQDYLAAQRGLSSNTILAYRDALSRIPLILVVFFFIDKRLSSC